MRFLGKTIKLLGNFVGVILSLLLSLALLVMLVITPVLSGLSALTRPETIGQVVQEIDFASVFLESFQGEMSEEERREMEFLVELTKTEAFADLTELYATDLTNAFEEEAKPSVLTKEALRRIVDENTEELIDILRSMAEDMGEDVDSYTDAELEEKIWELFEEMADKFLKIAPTAEDLRNLMIKISNKITNDSSNNDERPNSGMEYTDNEYDTPSFESGDEGGSTITVLPGGDGDTITSIIVGPDGIIQSGNDNYSYYVDPETGAIVIVGGDGNGDGATAIGGKFTVGRAVVVQNNTIRVLLMGNLPSGGEEQQEEIADVVFKLANMAKKGTLTMALVGVMTVFALLICLLRWPRFKGIMWVAVMLLVGALLLVMAASTYIALPGMIAGGDAEKGFLSAAEPVVKIIVNSMYVSAAIYASVAIVLIVLFVVFRKALRKQKAAKAAVAAQAETIEEIADEAEAAAELYEEVPMGNFVETEETPAEAEEVPAEEVEIPVIDGEVSEEEEIPVK